MTRDRERNVRVYTVACESRYVVVRNVPALGVLDELLQRLRLYGDVCEFRVLDHDDDRRATANDHNEADAEDEAAVRTRELDERFTEVVWVQFATVNNARHAKVRAVQKPFFGSVLQIAYAPQFESRDDALLKLTQRRELLQRRAGSGGERRFAQSAYPPPVALQRTGVEKTEFIGPQLPPRDWRRAPLLPPALPAEQLKPPQSQPVDAKPKRRRI